MESTFIKLIGEFGMVPTLLIIIAVVWFMLREIKKEVAGLNKGLEKVQAELCRKIDNLQEHSDEKDEELKKEFCRLEERVAFVEKEYVTKEDHYQDLGGWREEIRESHRKIDNISRLFLENIQKLTEIIYGKGQKSA